MSKPKMSLLKVTTINDWKRGRYEENERVLNVRLHCLDKKHAAYGHLVSLNVREHQENKKTWLRALQQGRELQGNIKKSSSDTWYVDSKIDPIPGAKVNGKEAVDVDGSLPEQLSLIK